MELRRRSVNERNKLRNTDGEEDSGECNVLYKLLGKYRTLMKGSLNSLKGSRIKLERVTKTEITCVVSSLSFLLLTKKLLRYKIISHSRKARI